MTPSIGVLQIETSHWRGCRVWLPLFLLWIPLIALSPLMLLTLGIACAVGRVNPWRAIASLWAISCSLPGTDVFVQSHGIRVLVRLI